MGSGEVESVSECRYGFALEAEAHSPEPDRKDPAMATKLEYHWHLRKVMADRGMQPMTVRGGEELAGFVGGEGFEAAVPWVPVRTLRAAKTAHAPAAEFADLADDELLEREAELDRRCATIREEHQRVFNERRKVKREKSRRGLLLPTLHDDDTDPDVSPREKLEAALAESKQRRQQRP
ncbi:hypothetical protein GCM10023237_39290 [Streptomyces coeruleoprunus]